MVRDVRHAITPIKGTELLHLDTTHKEMVNNRMFFFSKAIEGTGMAGRSRQGARRLEADGVELPEYLVIYG